MRCVTVFAAVACLAVLTGACGGGGGSETPTAPIADRDGDGIPDIADRCPSQPETVNRVLDRDGCPDVVTDLYPAVRSDVESFWASSFPSLYGRSYSSIARIQLFAGIGTSACGAGQGPFYCSADRVVYLDEPFMEDQIQRIGDFAAATIIAHEIGHHIQNLRGILGTISIQRELQADCLAGAWAISAGARGLLETGDFQEAARALFEAADPAGTPWFDPAAHGTATERQQFFTLGFNRGAAACG